MNAPSNRTDTIRRWVARIWSLPAIIFVLGEVFVPHAGDNPTPFIEWLALGLQITAVLGLALAWRWEILGGSLSTTAIVVSFIIFAIARSPLMLLQVGWVWVVFILIPGALFLANGLRRQPPGMRPT